MIIYLFSNLYWPCNGPSRGLKLTYGPRTVCIRGTETDVRTAWNTKTKASLVSGLNDWTLSFQILSSLLLYCSNHWALQYLEKALAAIFEAKNMARIGPCWRQLVPFIGSYHWPKRQCQASDKGLCPPGCKQKIVCESTRKRKIFQNIKFKIRNIFTLLCQHGGKSYFTPSNDARINYKSWEIR